MALSTALMTVFLLLFSVVAHEYAHGWMAEKCGDDTARAMGRLTFNPLPHIDIIGSIVLPMACIMLGTPVIAWAKPVPVDPNRFNNPRMDIVKVGLAGPVANIVVAVAFSLVLWVLPIRDSITKLLYETFNMGLYINLILAVFNMLPIPPLDGSKVVSGFLPYNLAMRYLSLEQYGFIAVFAMLYLGWINTYLTVTAGFLYRLLVP
ncbi:MAG: site-2 protease family protein [Elusimicrobiota bacterium]